MSKSNRVIKRFISVRTEIKFAFLLGAVSVLLIELILKNFRAPNPTFYRAGDLYLKLCYSLTASSIFFFINQHLPKEEKKEKVAGFINNKLDQIHNEVRQVLLNAKVDKELIRNREVDEHAVKIAWENIDPLERVFDYMDTSIPFDNWFEYLNFKSAKIKGLLDDLLTVNEYLSAALLEDVLTLIALLLPKKFDLSDLPKWNNESYLYYCVYKQYDVSLNALEKANKV